MKIDAPRIYANVYEDGTLNLGAVRKVGNYGDAYCRLVRESDWRKIMAVVKAADEQTHDWFMEDEIKTDIEAAVVALRDHLAKGKRKAAR